jgi:hypothetical protein
MGKSKWLRFLLVIPLLFVLVFTNVYIDPANIYHDYSKEIAESVLSGKPTHFGSSNVNEREVKHHIIKGMPDKVGCVAVGPSLVMGVRSENVGTDDFYNLGVSGADFYDILAQFGLMEAYNKKVDRVIFCVDSYFFNPIFFDQFQTHDSLKKYADYMISVLNGEQEEVPVENASKEIEKKIRQLFSVTYFQAAVAQIEAENAYFINRERWGIVNDEYRKEYYLSDASLVYSIDYQNLGEENVKNESKEYNIDVQFSKGEHISKDCENIFEKLINYLLEHGVKVELYLCPLAPSLWDRIDKGKNQYPILDELEEYANYVAEKYDLKITGSYNPYNLGMKDADFYDARHVRHELLETYLDFKADHTSLP